MVSSAYYNNTSNQEIRTMYDTLSSTVYAKDLQNLLENLPCKDHSERYVAISKKMVADINRLIAIDPQMLYRGNTDEQRSELQSKLSAFIWNRHEIMGDQSGQSLVTHIYGHTGNASIDAKDNRCTQISLDNLSSKLGDGHERVKFSAYANAKDENLDYHPRAAAIKLFFSPNAEKRRRSESLDVGAKLSY